MSCLINRVTVKVVQLGPSGPRNLMKVFLVNPLFQYENRDFRP